jgi:hypothetical protein
MMAAMISKSFRVIEYTIEDSNPIKVGWLFGNTWSNRSNNKSKAWRLKALPSVNISPRNRSESSS